MMVHIVDDLQVSAAACNKCGCPWWLSCLVLSCVALSDLVLPCHDAARRVLSWCRASFFLYRIISYRLVRLVRLALSCVFVAVPVFCHGSKNREAVPPVRRATQQLGPCEESLLLQDPPPERAARGKEQTETSNRRVL